MKKVFALVALSTVAEVVCKADTTFPPVIIDQSVDFWGFCSRLFAVFF
jgi:hypothetical protein